MSDFSHGIKNEAFLEGLRKLSAQESWWRDVLADRWLLIAIRDEYLNVYWQGQSIFRVAFQNGEVIATTHPKYLLNPDLSGQIPLIGRSFDLEKIIEARFSSTDTLLLMHLSLISTRLDPSLGRRPKHWAAHARSKVEPSAPV